MTAGAYRPLDRPPRSVFPPYDRAPARQQGRQERHAALLAALVGVPLGAHDRHIVLWLAGWDTAVVGTVASLFGRLRLAGHAEGHNAALRHEKRGDPR